MRALTRGELLFKACYQQYFNSEELEKLSDEELRVVAFEVEIDFNDEVFDGYSPEYASEIMQQHQQDFNNVLKKYNKRR